MADLPFHRASASGAELGQRPRTESACLPGTAAGRPETGAANGERALAEELPRGSVLPAAGGSCREQKQPYRGLQGYMHKNKEAHYQVLCNTNAQ